MRKHIMNIKIQIVWKLLHLQMKHLAIKLEIVVLRVISTEYLLLIRATIGWKMCVFTLLVV